MHENTLVSPVFIGMLLLVIPANGSPANERVVPQGEDVNICGLLIKKVGSGGPTFGEEPERDQKTLGTILELSEPVRIEAFLDARKGNVLNEVKEIQLFYSGEKGRVSKMLGKHVVAHGVISLADTGYQLTDFIMDVKALDSCQGSRGCAAECPGITAPLH